MNELTEDEKDMIYISKLYANMNERNKIAVMMLAEELTAFSTVELNKLNEELEKSNYTLDSTLNIV